MAACGNGGKKGDSKSTSSVESSTSSTAKTTVPKPMPPTTTATRLSREADLALARLGLLTLADLPPGWSVQPHIRNTDPGIDARIASCMGVSIALVNSSSQPHADSPDFVGPLGQRVQSGVAVFPDMTLPLQWIGLYATPDALTCLAGNLGPSEHASLTGAALPMPKVGDGIVGVRLTGGSVTVDVVFARLGRAIVDLVVHNPTDVNEPLLLTRMLERIS